MYDGPPALPEEPDGADDDPLAVPLVPVVAPDADEDMPAAPALWMVMSARMLPFGLVLRNAPEKGIVAALDATDVPLLVAPDAEMPVLVDGVAPAPAAGVGASDAAPAVGEAAAEALPEVEPVDEETPEDAEAPNGAMDPVHWFWPRTVL